MGVQAIRVRLQKRRAFARGVMFKPCEFVLKDVLSVIKTERPMIHFYVSIIETERACLIRYHVKGVEPPKLYHNHIATGYSPEPDATDRWD